MRNELHLGAYRAELSAEPVRLVRVRLLTDADRLLRDGVVYHLRRTAGPAGDFGRNGRSPLRILALFNLNLILHSYLSLSLKVTTYPSSLSITAKFM